MKIPYSIQKKLQERKESNAFRNLSCTSFPIDFWSNDYLGFSQSTYIKELTENILTKYSFQNGATGSRLISGNFPLYIDLEHFLSKFYNASSSLLFNSGYDANLGIFSSIPQKEDLILYDQYIHASIRDGIRLSNAKNLKFNHNDLNHLEYLLKKFSSKVTSIYIATESVFSMDGDSPNLPEMVSISEKYGAYLIVDEAHSTGIFGKQGKGLIEHLGLSERIFIRLMTFGKALGVHGAVVLADQTIIDFLVNFARSFIYTTGTSPHNVAQIMAAHQLLTKTNEQEKLYSNINFFKNILQKYHLYDKFIPSQSAIQSIMISGNDNVKQLATKLQTEGLGIKPILSPTVPKNQERLRICLHSFNTKNEINLLLNTLIN